MSSGIWAASFRMECSLNSLKGFFGSAILPRVPSVSVAKAPHGEKFVNVVTKSRQFRIWNMEQGRFRGMWSGILFVEWTWILPKLFLRRFVPKVFTFAHQSVSENFESVLLTMLGRLVAKPPRTPPISELQAEVWLIGHLSEKIAKIYVFDH